MQTESKKRFKCCDIPEISPQGWLKRQMEIQMDGLTGKLYDVWDCVGSYSGWLGGTGENWERGPYYLDGLLPLSWYLKDKKHWELACRFVEWTLGSTDETGNFGPEASKQDYWSRFVMLKVLIQYYEIKKDARVLELLKKYFDYLNKEIPKRPMIQWSKARIGDLLYCIHWYCEQTGETQGELVAELRKQALDWNGVFKEFPFTRPSEYYYNWKSLLEHYQKPFVDDIMKYHTNHIVNLTMGFKYPAMLSYFFDDMDFEKITEMGLRSAHRYHGVVSGVVNEDEHLAGNNPSRGSELCSVVEYMFSLQTMAEAFGTGRYTDQIEKLAYNALPATITEDFMAHQYLQQANQVLVSKAKRDWFNTNDESNLFGLEPNFGCCTANMHQGWPKLLKSMWLKEDENTLISMVHGPSSIVTELAGNRVSISEETEYPFKNRICYRVTEGNAPSAVFRIWIPEWCKDFRVCIDGAWKNRERTEDYLTVHGLHAGSEMTVEFSMDIRKSFWYKDSMAIERGPLVFALDMKEQWKKIREVAGVSDFEIYPESPWNYAIPKNGEVEVEEKAVSDVPFSKNNPPIVFNVTGKCVESWKIENNSAGDLPQSPVKAEGEAEKIRLIPFGCTKLRISQFPYYED